MDHIDGAHVKTGLSHDTATGPARGEIVAGITGDEPGPFREQPTAERPGPHAWDGQGGPAWEAYAICHPPNATW